jgi:hypothetical protein
LTFVWWCFLGVELKVFAGSFPLADLFPFPNELMGLWRLGILLVYLELGWSRRRADFTSARLDVN